MILRKHWHCSDDPQEVSGTVNHYLQNPKANTPYLFVFSVSPAADRTVTWTVSVTSSTAGTMHTSIEYQSAANEYTPSFGVWVYDYGSSPPSYDVLQVSISPSSGVKTIKNYNFAIFELEDDDEYAGADAVFNTSGTHSNWQDAVTLTFTPASAGEYLIVGAMRTNDATTTRIYNMRLLDDSSAAHLDMDVKNKQTTERRYYGVVHNTGSVSGSSTFKLQLASDSASSGVGVVYRYLVAIRLDNFPAVFSGPDSSHWKSATAEQSTTSTTYANAPMTGTGDGNSFTLASGNEGSFFTFVATSHTANKSGFGTNPVTYCKGYLSSEELFESIYTPVDTTNKYVRPLFGFCRNWLTATTWTPLVHHHVNTGFASTRTSFAHSGAGTQDGTFVTFQCERHNHDVQIKGATRLSGAVRVE